MIGVSNNFNVFIMPICFIHVESFFECAKTAVPGTTPRGLFCLGIHDRSVILGWSITSCLGISALHGV